MRQPRACQYWTDLCMTLNTAGRLLYLVKKKKREQSVAGWRTSDLVPCRPRRHIWEAAWRLMSESWWAMIWINTRPLIGAGGRERRPEFHQMWVYCTPFFWGGRFSCYFYSFLVRRVKKNFFSSEVKWIRNRHIFLGFTVQELRVHLYK